MTRRRRTLDPGDAEYWVHARHTGATHVPTRRAGTAGHAPAAQRAERGARPRPRHRGRCLTPRGRAAGAGDARLPGLHRCPQRRGRCRSRPTREAHEADPGRSDRQARSDHRRGGRRGRGSRHLCRLRPASAHPGCGRLWLRAGVRPRHATARPGLALLCRRVPAAAGVDLDGSGWFPASRMAAPAAAGGPRGPDHPPCQQPRGPGRRRTGRGDQPGHIARRGPCAAGADDPDRQHLCPRLGHPALAHGPADRRAADGRGRDALRRAWGQPLVAISHAGRGSRVGCSRQPGSRCWPWRGWPPRT